MEAGERYIISKTKFLVGGLSITRGYTEVICLLRPMFFLSFLIVIFGWKELSKRCFQLC